MTGVVAKDPHSISEGLEEITDDYDTRVSALAGSGYRYERGDVIDGRYQLVAQLGAGGMGEVWRAHHLGLDVHVAVKLIRNDLRRWDLSARLLREARVIARLPHTAVVRVLDFGCTEHDDPFMVMELLRGASLSTLIDRRGPLAPVEAVQLLLPIAEALAEAHEHQILHRDLKPDNIFVCPLAAGCLQPKVLDFGISRLASRPRSPRRLTLHGAVMGSPDYLSPEQALGADVDARADIWAFCVVLYETLAGVRPFFGPTPQRVIHAILHRAASPLTLYGKAQASLWEIIERGLAKDPAQRPASMKQLGWQLADWARRQGTDQDVTGAGLSSRWAADCSANDRGWQRWLLDLHGAPAGPAAPAATTCSQPTAERVTWCHQPA